MFTPASPLSIDPSQKYVLESLVRAGTTPQSVARKCEVILLASTGVPNNSIAQQTGLSRPTVIATRMAFGRGGVEALRQPQKRKRSRRVLTPELQQKILDTTLKTRPPDATHWSVRTLASHLGVTRILVHGAWQRFDLQPHRIERFKLSNDPKFEEKVRDVVGLYLDPPARRWTEPLPFWRCCPGYQSAKRMITSGTGPPRCLPPATSSMARSLAVACRAIAAKSSSSFSINSKRKYPRNSISISFWTTTARTKASRSSVDSSPGNAAAFTSTSHRPAVPGSIKWSVFWDSSQTR
jgi:transposase